MLNNNQPTQQSSVNPQNESSTDSVSHQGFASEFKMGSTYVKEPENDNSQTSKSQNEEINSKLFKQEITEINKKTLKKLLKKKPNDSKYWFSLFALRKQERSAE